MAILRDILKTLKTAPRTGAEVDEPEGVRYIRISETLALRLADQLEQHLHMKEPNHPPRCPVCGVDLTDRMEEFGLKDPQ